MSTLEQKAEKMRELAIKIEDLLTEEAAQKADLKKTKDCREILQSELQAMARADDDQMDLFEDQMAEDDEEN
jgi:DNA-binding GntR family transcriptional regulator